MPKGKRGSRGTSKGPSHRISLGWKVIAVPPGTTKAILKQVLTDSINGDYSLPEGYMIEVEWVNGPPGSRETRSDEWTNALIDSSSYSRGWDRLLLKRLENY